VAADITVSTGDIARLGHVGRAAVSNWRRRHDDFPAPVSGSVASPRFALTDVEAWLRRNGKRYRLSAADRAWQRLRSGEPGGADLGLPARLAAAGVYLLARHDPELVALLPADPELHDPELATLLGELADTLGPTAAFEDLCARHRRRPGEPTEALATDMASIALPAGGSVLDPACGTGVLLLAAGAANVAGQDADPGTALIAATRLLLAGARRGAPVVVGGDALRADAFAGREFDAVLSAPPVADRVWARDELAADARFTHGLPPRTEPELAWVQHGLAHVRPGGRVVLRLPAAVASRRSGRRVRANLLRAGVLHAVVAVEDDADPRPGGAPPGDVWVLRRPGPDDPPPSAVLLARTGAAELADLWDAFAVGAASSAGRARAVPILDLLDDDVDLAPDRHLPRRTPIDAVRVFVELRRRAPAAVPGLRTTDGPGARSDASVAELGRTGVLAVRHAPRALPAGGWGDVPVLTAADLAGGTTPTGRTETGPELVRTRPGDVVVGPGGSARVTDHATVIGPGLTVYRTDSEQLDPEFLAGVLRSAPAGGSSRHRRSVRVPLLPIAEQRAHGKAFRALLDAADAAREAAERAEALLRLGSEGLTEGWLEPE
jgi:SAM-dependent methyltransferase